MFLLDTRQQATDDKGNILAGGQYRFFAYHTITPVSWFADPEFLVDMGPEMQLDAGGWPPMTGHFKEDVTVHSYKYLGMDEYGVEIYSPVKVWDLMDGSSSSGTAPTTFINTMTDLKSLDAVDGTSVILLGYHNKGDMPALVYRYSASAVGLDDGGSCIESAVMSTGRWVATFGDIVDARNFGVTAGLVANPYLASAVGYCNATQKTLYIDKNNYLLYGAGELVINCPLKIAKDVNFNVSGDYTLYVQNPNVEITNTFAGNGLKLIFNGVGFEQTTIPLTAFNVNAKGYDQGTAHFNLLINASGYSWSHGATYNDIILGESTYTINFSTFTIHGNELKGNGKLSFATEANLSCNVLHTKNVTGLISKATSLTKEHLIVDSDVELGTADIDVWDTLYSPRMTISANLSSYSQVKIPPRFSCTNNALSGSLFDFGKQQLNPYWFSSNTSLVNSINASSFEYLDLQGATLSTPLGRGLTLKNGTVYRLQDNCTLHNVTVTDRYLGTYVNATDCVFQGMMPNLQGSKLTRVVIEGGTATNGPMNGHNSIWNEVTVERRVNVVGGSARWVNVDCFSLVCIPDNDFTNLMWYGGSANSVLFDATAKSSTTDSLCHNVHIQNVLGLDGDISSSNGSTKKWAFMGHTNVRIGNNAKGKATFGSKSFTITGGGPGGVSTGLENKVFLFNTGGTGYAAENEYVNSATVTAQYYSTDDTNKGVELYASYRPLRYSNGQQLFYLHVGNNSFGTLTTGDKLWITFEVYK